MSRVDGPMGTSGLFRLAGLGGPQALAERPTTFLVLSEDDSRHTVAAVEALLRSLLLHVDPRCRPDRLRFEPVNDAARSAVSLHDFTDRRRNIDRARLHRNILETLMSDGFVVLHIDAERRWSDRTADPSEKVERLQRHVVAHVRVGLEGVLRRQHPGLDDAELRARIDARMARFFRLVAYWQLESWLYQNSERARALCLANPACRGGHVELMATWAADRGLLDETPCPAQMVCFGKPQHRGLLDTYPTAAVVAASKSLAQFVETLRASEALQDALRRTHRSSSEPPPTPAPDPEPEVELELE